MSVWERGWDPDALPPTALWGSLVRSGYGIVYALEVEGIPYLFGERELWTIRDVEAGRRNADDITMSHALVIDEGTRIAQACDREKGLASGRAVDFTFGRQQLADESLSQSIFARPTLRATLTSDVTDATTDVFVVDNSASWASTGLFYVGRECVRYTYAGLDGGSVNYIFGGCIRGVAGQPHYHTASTSSAYRQCTDKPVYWRGRLVTLWAHLVSPEGRYLGERWAERGEFCRQDWRGYVRDAPRSDAAGIVLTCLPLVRLASQEFGAEVTGKVARDTDGLPWIVSEPSDTVHLNNPSLVAYTVPSRPIETNSGIVSLRTWAAIAENHLYALETSFGAQFDALPSGLYIRIRETEATTATYHGPQTTCIANAWFLTGGAAPSIRLNPQSGGIGGPGGYEFVLKWRWDEGTVADRVGWIVVRIDEQADFVDAVVGSTGFLLLEDGEHKEVCRYDKTVTNNDNTKRAFRIVQRNMLGTSSIGSRWSPWVSDTTVSVLSGAAGLWEACLATLMTSSGTGSRGAYDSLAYGYGIGIPYDWILTGIEGYPAIGHLPREPIAAVTTGKTSVEDILCGWLALTQSCLVQRRSDDGDIRLTVVSTSIVDDPTADTLTSSDVLLNGHETPETIEAPNHIRIVASDQLNERPEYVVRDTARAQAEGVRSLEVKAPGITSDQALRYGGELLLLGDGQCAISVRVPPWVEFQIGDAVNIATQHPVMFNWADGSFDSESDILGRVVGHERNLWDQSQMFTIVLAGQAQERKFLCPCALVEERVSATVYRVAKGDALGFAAGDSVRGYTPGNEGGYTDVTLSSIDEGEEYDVFTVDVDPGIDAGGYFTFGFYDTCTARQLRFVFNRDPDHFT